LIEATVTLKFELKDFLELGKTSKYMNWANAVQLGML